MAGSSSGIEPLYREKLLQEVKSPLLCRPDPGIDRRRTGNGRRSISTPSCRPTTPTWSRRRACRRPIATCSSPSGTASSASRRRTSTGSRRSCSSSARHQGLKLFRDIVATNGISVRKGHSLLNNLVVAGEVPLALTIYGFIAEQAKAKGAPLDWFVIPPLIARPTAAGVARNAPHPHAAVLFYDFLIGDAQPILASRQFVIAEHEDRIAIHQDAAASSSIPVDDARPCREVAGPLSEDHRQRVAVSARTR